MTHTAQGSRNITEEVGKSVRAGKWEESCEMLSSGHDVAIVFMNSLQLCLPAQEQAEKISEHSNRQHQLNSVAIKKKVEEGEDEEKGNMLAVSGSGGRKIELECI